MFLSIGNKSLLKHIIPPFPLSNSNLNEKLSQWLLLDDYDSDAICMAEKKNPTIKKAKKEVTYLTGDESVKRMEFLHEDGKWIELLILIMLCKKNRPLFGAMIPERI